jgi:chromosome segregation ATPase
MNTPTPFGKKTFAEYEKEVKEYNLSKVERIELTLAGDLEELSKLQIKYHKEANKLNAKLDSAENQVQSTDSKYGKIKKEEEELKELLTKDWETYRQLFSEAKDVDSQGSKIWSRADKALGNYSRAAKELGVNPRDNKAYMKVWSMHNELAGELDDLMMRTKQVVKVKNI